MSGPRFYYLSFKMFKINLEILGYNVLVQHILGIILIILYKNFLIQYNSRTLELLNGSIIIMSLLSLYDFGSYWLLSCHVFYFVNWDLTL